MDLSGSEIEMATAAEGQSFSGACVTDIFWLLKLEIWPQKTT